MRALSPTPSALLVRHALARSSHVGKCLSYENTDLTEHDLAQVLLARSVSVYRPCRQVPHFSSQVIIYTPQRPRVEKSFYSTAGTYHTTIIVDYEGRGCPRVPISAERLDERMA